MASPRFRAGVFAIALIAALCPALAAAQSEAAYSVRFDATWSEATHPFDFPSNPHFSGLIGGTHHDGVSFWDLGELASPGIESMAETGSKVLLQAEVQAAIDAGTALAVISGGSIPLSPGSVSESFTIAETHPLVTLVSMLAPSPDWFVGVSGLSLREAGQWVEHLVVPLVVYDSGTDSGTMYGSSNQPTIPPIPIYEKSEVPFDQDNVVGTFTFSLETTSVPWLAESAALQIRMAGPNPARSTSSFEIRAADRPVDLRIHDTAGRLVRTLLSGERVERRTVAWDGRDRNGHTVPTGVYFATLVDGVRRESAKLVLIR